MATPDSSEPGGDAPRPDELKIMRMDAMVWALTAGVMAGLALFLATNWLVLQGGQDVGQHLALLSNYFVGYSVTFVGSLVGFCYAAFVGFVATWILVTVYNRVTHLRHGDRGA